MPENIMTLEEAAIRVQEAKQEKERLDRERQELESRRKEEERKRREADEKKKKDEEEAARARLAAIEKATKKRNHRLEVEALRRLEETEKRDWFNHQHRHRLKILDKRRNVKIAWRESEKHAAEQGEQQRIADRKMRIRRLFHFFDFDRDKRVTAEDVWVRLKQLGTPYTQQEVGEMVEELGRHVPLVVGSSEKKESFLAAGTPLPDLAYGSFTRDPRLLFFGTEQPRPPVPVRESLADSIEIPEEEAAAARREEAGEEDAAVQALLSNFGISLGEDLLKHVVKPRTPTPPPPTPPPPPVPLCSVGYDREAFFEAMLTCLEVTHPPNCECAAGAYYMPPLFVSVVEYLLSLNPCDKAITTYEALEAEILSPEGVVTAEDCMVMVFRRTGEPSGDDIGRMFGYGYIGNGKQPLPLNQYLRAVHMARRGMFEGADCPPTLSAPTNASSGAAPGPGPSELENRQRAQGKHSTAAPSDTGAVSTPQLGGQQHRSSARLLPAPPPPTDAAEEASTAVTDATSEAGRAAEEGASTDALGGRPPPHPPSEAEDAEP